MLIYFPVAIQSVLDVKDDTPFPRGTNQQPIFNRSILILTPARALKFTAPTRERHYVWLTALSFLSHSAQSADGLLALPPPMPFEFEQVQQQQAYQTNNRMLSSTEAPNYSSIRDSIRIAKGRSKPEPNGFRQNANALMHKNSIREVSSIISNDSVAEPPSIPRFPGHSRKRSNTGSRPPNPRSFSNGISANSSYRGSIHGDSMYYGNGVVGGVGIISGNSSIAHGSAGGGWDAPVGTVRMEAFVERKSRSEYDEDEYQVPSSYRLRKERSRRDNNYWGPPANVDFYTGMEDDDFFRSDDPFRGF